MEKFAYKLVGKDPEHLHHLIVYAHPYHQSLSAAYRDEVVRLSRKYGADVIIRDLYEIGFNPLLSAEDMAAFRDGKVPPAIAVEADYIRWADLITFIYPIWWAGMPAMAKGYIDRVFYRGFAYDVGINGDIVPLLTDKKVILLNNMGASTEQYEQVGMLNAFYETVDLGIFAFCGCEVLRHKFFGEAATASREQCEGYIREMETIYWKYFAE
ncbi:MAG: NAD(P)H-dependent oxidoreductase [Marinifilaceae bacterium]